MLIHKVVKGFVILKNRDDKYDPPTTVSMNWKHWKATWDIKTCEQCKGEHGKIYAMNDQLNPEPPLHPNCRCEWKQWMPLQLDWRRKMAIRVQTGG